MERNIKHVVEKIIKQTLNISEFPAEFSPKKSLDTIGVDSVLLLEIIVKIEEEFGIAIADESLNDLLLSSVEGLVKLVQQHWEKEKT